MSGTVDIKEMETALRVVLTEVLEEKFGAEISDIKELLHKHDATLYGNGKEGLVEIVHRNDKFIQGFITVGMAVTIAVLTIIVVGLIVLLVNHGQMGEPVREAMRWISSRTWL